MANERLFIIIVLFAAAIIGLILAVVAWRRRRVVGLPAIYFSISMLGGIIYSFGYAMEISSNMLPDIMFWVQFQHLGIWVLTPAWLLFSLCMTGKEKFITPRRIAVLSIISTFFFLSALELGNGSLFHLNPRIITTDGFSTFIYDRGLVAWLGLVYISICLAGSTFLFSLKMFRAAPAFRKQAALLLIGSLIPWIGMVVYALELTPYNLDTSPISMSLSGLIFSFGFLKLRLFDIVPLARDVIFESMNDGVLVMDTHDQIIDFNPHLLAMLPRIPRTPVGFSAFDALADYPVLLEMIKDSSFQPVEFSVDIAGTIYHYRSTPALLRDWRKKEAGKIIVLHDYTQMKQLLEQLEELATRDSLTGIYNRRHFNKLAAEELYRFQRYGGSMSLIMMDIDYFKRINDTYGHAAGDAALRAVVKVCEGALRQSDIMGRYGGEEFVFLMPQTDSTAALNTAHRLLTAIEQHHIEYEGHSFVVEASFGVASVASPSNILLDEILRCVDQALYEAKKAGRNQICVCDSKTFSVSPASTG
ncbi:MAG: diguanylate cyclase [Anaerolineaceae bacterium]|nr:diguanylate cyclase [Anaerolineaceae bacterium]